MPVNRPRRVLAAATALTLGLVLAGCSKDEEPEAEPSETPTPSTAPARPSTVTFGELVGRVPKPARKQMRIGVMKTVDHYLDAGYLGEYPRTDFGAAFEDFTRIAKRRAAQDADLLTNRAIGAQTASVEATKRRVALDVLSVAKRPVGVTARFVLALRVTPEGDSGAAADSASAEPSGAEQDGARMVRVTGRLQLTRAEGGWQIFGYDVSRGGNQ